MVTRAAGPMATAMGTAEVEEPLIPFEDGVFLTRVPTIASWTPAVFYSLPDGSRSLHLIGRATPRV